MCPAPPNPVRSRPRYWPTRIDTAVDRPNTGINATELTLNAKLVAASSSTPRLPTRNTKIVKPATSSNSLQPSRATKLEQPTQRVTVRTPIPGPKTATVLRQRQQHDVDDDLEQDRDESRPGPACHARGRKSGVAEDPGVVEKNVGHDRAHVDGHHDPRFALATVKRRKCGRNQHRGGRQAQDAKIDHFQFANLGRMARPAEQGRGKQHRATWPAETPVLKSRLPATQTSQCDDVHPLRSTGKQMSPRTSKCPADSRSASTTTGRPGNWRPTRPETRP